MKDIQTTGGPARANRSGGARSTRTLLIESAAAVFAEHGFDAASVRAITRAAGANLGAVTYHFGGKRGLFAAVIEHRIAPLRAIGERIAAGGASPEAKLRATMREYALYVLHHDPLLKSFFAEMISGGARLPPVAVEGVAWRNELVRGFIREGIRDGSFRPCDLDCAPWLFFGMLSAYILYEPLMEGVARGGRYALSEAERIAEAASDIFLCGLRRTTARRVGRRPR